MSNGAKEENERIWRKSIEWHLKQIRELLERILKVIEGNAKNDQPHPRH